MLSHENREMSTHSCELRAWSSRSFHSAETTHPPSVPTDSAPGTLRKDDRAMRDV